MNHINLKLQEAQVFVKQHHRHSEPLKRHMFSIGAVKYPGGFELLGVVTVDRCSSAWSKRRDHVEIRRLCVKPNAPKNVASYLISRAKDACWAMGYNTIITYTKPHELGSSLLATGFYVQKAKWSPADPSHPMGLVQWCVSRGRQLDSKVATGERQSTKKLLAEIGGTFK